MFWLPLSTMILMGQGETSNLKSVAGPQAVQAPSHDLDDAVKVDDVEVSARRGAAQVMPETELDGADIDALGAWDIGEVLQRMSETLSVGDEPMVIINGRRVANSAVFSGFPPDALVRAEVLPPEAAALYGGAAGQRVINLVLQRRFSSHDARVVGGRPTQGGTSSISGDMDRSSIAGQSTHHLGVRASRDTALRAEERDRDLAGDGREAGEITLRPPTEAFSVNANMTGSLGDWSSVFSLTAQTTASRSIANLGGGLVESHRQNEGFTGGGGLSGTAIGWTVLANLNGQMSRSREDGFTDTRNENHSLTLSVSASRPLVDLPAGPVTVNLDGNLAGSRIVIDRDLRRTTNHSQTQQARGSLAIPLLRANRETKGIGLGALQATVGGGIRQTGPDHGSEVSGGLAWNPRTGLRLNGVWSASSDSLSDLQRFEPLYYGTPRVVFDFQTGEAVEIVPILGGNPDLRPPRSERLSLMAAAGPFTSWTLSGNLGYQRAEMIDGIGSLPELTEDVEAAFPHRFRRDGDGKLISIDYRAMNLRSSLMEGLNASLNFSLPRPAGVAANPTTTLRASLTYGLRLRNTVALMDGRPDLDRLQGDGGGVSRQDARIMLDARRGRWGVNASARWQEGYRTRRISGQNDPRDLVTGSFTAMDLNVIFQMTSSSMRPGQDGEDGSPRRRSGGLQLNIEIENLFDARGKAHLGDGSPAPGYGRDMQDPIGRTIRLTLQRRF